MRGKMKVKWVKEGSNSFKLFFEMIYGRSYIYKFKFDSRLIKE